MPYSLAFLLSEKDIPAAALSMEDDSLQEFCREHPPQDDYISYERFDSLAMLKRLALQLGLNGLDYFHHPWTVLDASAMDTAIESLQAVERFFRENPEEGAVFLSGSLFSKQIVAAMERSSQELEEEDPNNVIFYQMLGGARAGLNQMRDARERGCYYVYMLGDVNERITQFIQELDPKEPPYSKEYLLEIERTVEQGVDDAQLPFDPPQRDSQTVSDAAKWLRQTIMLLPVMTEDIQPARERALRAHHLKGQMRKAAIASLWSSNLAPEFLDKFTLPDFDALVRQHAAGEVDDQAADAIVAFLSTVTEKEKHTFPGTIGESIGLQYYTGKQWMEWNGEQWLPVPEGTRHEGKSDGTR